MKTAIKIIKRQQKLKEPIKLRVKNLKNGNQSLYLDIYWQGKRTYQFLHLYLVPEEIYYFLILFNRDLAVENGRFFGF